MLNHRILYISLDIYILFWSVYLDSYFDGFMISMIWRWSGHFEWDHLLESTFVSAADWSDCRLLKMQQPALCQKLDWKGTIEFSTSKLSDVPVRTKSSEPGALPCDLAALGNSVCFYVAWEVQENECLWAWGQGARQRYHTYRNACQMPGTISMVCTEKSDTVCAGSCFGIEGQLDLLS